MSKRPTRYDEAVIAAGVEALWPDVAEYLGEDAPTEPDDIESHKRSLRQAFRYESDAYKAARDLEYDGWDPDADLVDVLERGDSKIRDAERAAVKAWVASGGVKADLPDGTRVKHPQLKGHVGTIQTDKYNHRAEGRYSVFCEALGHVRAEEVDRRRAAGDRTGCYHLGIILPAEEVEVVAEGGGAR